MKRRIASTLFVLVAASIGVANPAGGGDVVPHRFIITDEVYDFERSSSGWLAYRSWNFGTAIGEGVATQARIVFADDPGRALSQYHAEHGHVICLNNDYLVTADLAWSLTREGPVILDLSGALFQHINGDWNLRSDWQTRVSTYANRAGGNYNANTTLFIVVFNEVTGSDLTSAEIGQVAAEIKLRFPAGIKVAAGYPTTNNREDELPPSFPSQLDLIATWDYSIADPQVAPYYNPSNPTDPNTKYGKLVQRLQGSQDIFFLVAGFNLGDVLGQPSRIHQSTDVYFGTLLRRWCQLALKTHPARNAGLIVWKYNDGYGCTGDGSCNTTCSGVPPRRLTGANKTFAYEESLGINALARAYRSVYRAAAFGESCWQP